MTTEPSKPSKSWQGRFSRDPAKRTEQFVESVSFDARLYREDIRGSIAHVQMLAKTKLIDTGDAEKIISCLQDIATDIEAGKVTLDPALEDIHMVVEAELINRLGPVGARLHAGRSRNDQVTLDLRLHLRRVIDEQLCPAIVAVQKALLGLADRYRDLVMPGYTHLQRAQPVSAAAVLLAYAEMLDRDRDRFMEARRRINISPLGSAALAGTTLPIDRNEVASALGFPEITTNTIDAVSDRDYVIDVTYACAMVAMHLSRLAEDWIIWSSEEFGFLIVDEAYCTGSSIMPQKRNPDVLELIRGRSGQQYGHLVALLTLMKAQPLAYNRDMQEDKRSAFAAIDNCLSCLDIAEPVIRTAAFDESRIAARLERGFMDATVLAEYLVARGVPFRQAHHIVGSLVQICEKQGCELPELTLEVFQQACEQIDQDVYEYLGSAGVPKRYVSAFAAGQAGVLQQLELWRQRLAGQEKSSDTTQ